MKTPEQWLSNWSFGGDTKPDVFSLIREIQDDSMIEQRRLDSAICDKWRDKLDAATANSIKAEILGDL